jgi:hypothetical protein
MAKQSNTRDGRKDAYEESALTPDIKAYIDHQIQKSNDSEDISKKKRWKNTWHPSSLVAIASFVLTAAIAIATVINTIVAIRTFSLSTEALLDVQRATISADTFTVARQHGKDGQIDGLQFVTGWKNSGSTSTKNMVYWSNWRKEPWGSKIDQSFDFSDVWQPTGEKVSYTHGFATAQKLIPYYPMVIPRNLVEDVVGEKVELIFWGRATYNDVFKGTKVHTSEYCLRVMGFDGADPFDTTATSTTYPRFLNCPVHNCHDDECNAH